MAQHFGVQNTFTDYREMINSVEMDGVMVTFFLLFLMMELFFLKEKFGYKDVLVAINPKYAVVSVGTNSYGHPEQCALSFLAQSTSQVFRTDRDGTCVFESDGTGWEHMRF
jgi:hypothetical protein